MKAILEVDLNSCFPKSTYRIQKKGFELQRPSPHFYPIDTICYSSHDAHNSILHDIVIDYAENRPKQGELKYTLFIDQATNRKSAEAFIRSLSNLEVFKSKQNSVSHFLLHGNGIFDYHSPFGKEEQSDRSNMTSEKWKNKQIDESFQAIYNKEINLCQEIKLAKIASLQNQIKYIPIDQFISQNDNHNTNAKGGKGKENVHPHRLKQLENKNFLEFFSVKIGTQVRVHLILLKYNKSYGLNRQEKEELIKCLKLYGAEVGSIRFKTVKVQTINCFMKGLKKLFYYGFFPGPQLLHIQSIQKAESRKFSSHTSTAGFLQSTNSTFYPPSSLISKASSPLKRTKSKQKGQKSQMDILFEQYFDNLKQLREMDKENQQKIVKDYLEQKQTGLINELEKVSERLKEVQMIHRIESTQINDFRGKMFKILERFSKYIEQLKKMGINNIEKHISWVQCTIDEKKQTIKEEELEIEGINHRIIESKRKHEYFVKKMIAYRNKLNEKRKLLANSIHVLDRNIVTTPSEASQTPIVRNSQIGLTDAQLENLEQHRESLREKMHQKLKNSQQKTFFMENMNQIRKRASKLQISKLQQKYFDLFHE